MRNSKAFMTGISLALCAALALTGAVPARAAGDTYEGYLSGSGAEGVPDGESGYTVISVSTEEELAELARSCELDAWSRDKYVRLENDICLAEHRDLSIPSFGGIFDGGGHRISNLKLSAPGSASGMFRYIQEKGVVRNLRLQGVVYPEGSRSMAGILAGVNYGRIIGCEAAGAVTGDGEVGGIAGVNESTGEIRACASSALVTGNHFTGGICGANYGVLNNCSNTGDVNTRTTEVSYDIEDITMERLEDLNSADNLSAHTDTGGIAGYSEGKIYYCANYGNIGYPHVGYNVGGIAGRLHQGYLQNCSNTGHVMGRKDVGGIVGQMEPFLEVRYLNDKLGEIDRESERLIDLMEASHDDLSRYGSQASDLSEEITAGLRAISQASANLTSTANDLWYIYNQELAGIGDDLKRLNTDLEEITGPTVSGGDLIPGGSLGNPENITVTLPDNTESYRAALRRFGDSAGGHLTNITDATSARSEGVTDNLNTLNSETDGVTRNLEELSRVLGEGSDKNSENMDALTAQIRVLRTSVKELRDDLFRYEGISVADASDEAAGGGPDDAGADGEVYYDTLSFQQGKITLCVNQGKVEADANVGGIVGQVATEYDFDPEDDITFTGTESFNIEQTAKAIVRESRNLGDVEGKKDYVGGIVGKADFGAVISCESYGAVSSTGGSYVGGIAGASSYCVRSCSFMGELSGKNYVGGIAGKGCDVFHSYAYPTLELTGEHGGSIAGGLAKEGVLSGNYYVSGNIPGVDSMGFSGGAEPLPYEEFCGMEGVPAAFRQFKVTFLAEGRELASLSCGYGDSLAGLIPEIPEKEGCYGVWPEFDYDFVTGNRVLEARYEPWVSSLAGGGTGENGRTKVLVQGRFLPETELFVSEKPEGTEVSVLYAAEKPDGGAGPLRVRALCEDTEKTVVELWRDGAYTQAPAEVIGSYLQFDMENGGIFRLTVPRDNRWMKAAGAAGAAAAAGLLILLAVKLGKKRKRKANSA